MISTVRGAAGLAKLPIGTLVLMISSVRLRPFKVAANLPSDVLKVTCAFARAQDGRRVFRVPKPNYPACALAVARQADFLRGRVTLRCGIAKGARKADI